MGQAVNGPLKEEHLVSVPIKHTTWEDCVNSIRRQKFSPVTPVSYTIMAAQYKVSIPKMESFFPPLSFLSIQYHHKVRVIGIENNGNFKVYPFVELSQKKSPLKDVLVGQQIITEFNIETWNGILHDDKGEVLPSTNAFWLAWYAFHPETQILRSSKYGLPHLEQDSKMLPNRLGFFLKETHE